MKTLYWLFVLVAGCAAGLNAPLLALTADSLDQTLTILQTYEPNVVPRVGEVLPPFGLVRLVVNIDENGKLDDWLVLEYSYQRYVDAAVEAVKKWQYKPAILHGVAIGVRAELVFNFESSGQVVCMTGIDLPQSFTRNIIGDPQIMSVCPSRELDSIPKPTVVVSPSHIHNADTNGQTKEVLVDFYIDETGRPRMAAADVDGNMEMTSACLQAIEQWRFTPPTRHGKPVLTRATQRFDFSSNIASAK
jgi:TonB family protein